MFLVKINRNQVEIPHREKMTAGSSGYLLAELEFSKEWYRTDLEVFVYFASTTGFRIRKKLSDLLDKPLYDCVWDDHLPQIAINALATAEPGTVQIGFAACKEWSERGFPEVVIPTVWGTLGQVEKSVMTGEIEPPDPEDPVEPTPTPPSDISMDNILAVVVQYLKDNEYVTESRLQEALGELDTSGETPQTVVKSFNGRTGAVLPKSGDYTPEMVGVRAMTKSELEELTK